MIGAKVATLGSDKRRSRCVFVLTLCLTTTTRLTDAHAPSKSRKPHCASSAATAAVSPSPQCSHWRRRDPSRSDTRTDLPRRRPTRAATREPTQTAQKTTCFTLLSEDLLSEPSLLKHEKARGRAIHYY